MEADENKLINKYIIKLNFRHNYFENQCGCIKKIWGAQNARDQKMTTLPHLTCYHSGWMLDGWIRSKGTLGRGSCGMGPHGDDESAGAGRAYFKREAACG